MVLNEEKTLVTIHSTTYQVDVILNINELKSFGCYFRKSYTAKGTFKKFIPVYFFQVENHQYTSLRGSKAVLKEISSLLNCEKSYNHVEEFKKFGHVYEATEVTYRVLPK